MELPEAFMTRAEVAALAARSIASVRGTLLRAKLAAQAVVERGVRFKVADVKARLRAAEKLNAQSWAIEPEGTTAALPQRKGG
jgi:hypothetical protein